MQVSANINAITNISTAQEVAANNIANINTDGFKASTVVQGTDKVTISQAARAAAQNANGEELSTTDAAQDMVTMEINETSLNANVKAIQTQDEMNKALMGLNDPKGG